MRHNLYARLILAFIVCSTSLAAQEQRTLRGKVIPGDSPPPRLWGSVTIKVKNRLNNQAVAGPQEVTDDENWYHLAPLGALVDVRFARACYVPDGLYEIRVNTNRDLETVELQKTRECLIAERRQRRRRARFGPSSRSAAMVRRVVPVPGADIGVTGVEGARQRLCQPLSLK